MSANQMPWDGEYRKLGLHGLPMDRMAKLGVADDLCFEFDTVPWWQAVAYETELLRRFLGVEFLPGIHPLKHTNLFVNEIVQPIRVPEARSAERQPTQLPAVDCLPRWFSALEDSFDVNKPFMPPAWKALYLSLVSEKGFSVTDHIQGAAGWRFDILPLAAQERLISHVTEFLFERYAVRKAGEWVKKHMMRIAEKKEESDDLSMSGFLIVELHGSKDCRGIVTRQLDKLKSDREFSDDPHSGHVTRQISSGDGPSVIAENRDIISQFTDLEKRAFLFTLTRNGTDAQRVAEHWERHFVFKGDETVEQAKAASVSAWKKALALRREGLI